MTTQTDSGSCRRERLDKLVAELSEGVPGDPKPATTRALVTYLRIFQTCGPEDMYDAIMSNLYASVMALKVDSGNVRTAYVAMAFMLNMCAEDFLEPSEAKEGEAK